MPRRCDHILLCEPLSKIWGLGYALCNHRKPRNIYGPVLRIWIRSQGLKSKQENYMANIEKFKSSRKNYCRYRTFAFPVKSLPVLLSRAFLLSGSAPDYLKSLRLRLRLFGSTCSCLQEILVAVGRVEAGLELYNLNSNTYPPFKLVNKISVAEPKPVEPKLFKIRSRNYH